MLLLLKRNAAALFVGGDSPPLFAKFFLLLSFAGGASTSASATPVCLSPSVWVFWFCFLSFFADSLGTCSMNCRGDVEAGPRRERRVKVRCSLRFGVFSRTRLGRFLGLTVCGLGIIIFSLSIRFPFCIAEISWDATQGVIFMLLPVLFFAPRGGSAALLYLV